MTENQNETFIFWRVREWEVSAGREHMQLECDDQVKKSLVCVEYLWKHFGHDREGSSLKEMQSQGTTVL